MSDDAGSIVTVDGRLDPDELGITMTHEHMFIDTVDAWYQEPPKPQYRKLAGEPISMDDLHYIHLQPHNHASNLRLESREEAIKEVSLYQQAGGSSIVDVTPKDAGADPEGVRAIARATGLNFIQGTAYYTQASHPPSLSDRSVEDLAAEFESDVTEGIDDTDVRAGIIGELGVSGDIHEDEENVLRAGARAARRTGAPISIHPPLYHEKSASYWALEILDILEEEGLAPEQVILCHQEFEDPVETTTLTNQLEFAERGGYVEFDAWGWHYDNIKQKQASPSDNWRMRAVLQLVEEGYESNLLFSQDVWTKIQRTKYGGFGYAHVLRDVVPRLEHRGVSRETLDQILIDNPRDVLTFANPE
jgi:phosphotriesterase-related protein